jgi:uncharacterized damage-inducible protein DinB
MLADFVERLAGTPARLEERVRGLDPAIARAQVDNAWSIQQNAGHLADVEELWQRRIAELGEGRTVFTAADPAYFGRLALRHQDRPMAEILEEFRVKRLALTRILQAVSPEVQLRRALHERLNVRMRLVDIAQFTAEHDDNHLLRIAELRARLEAGR